MECLKTLASPMVGVGMSFQIEDFEVVQVHLHRFLQHYSDLIMNTPELRQASKVLRDEQEECSKRTKQFVQPCLCLVGYLCNLQRSVT